MESEVIYKDVEDFVQKSTQMSIYIKARSVAPNKKKGQIFI
jgi:fibrillarin-like rRNA methylase